VYFNGVLILERLAHELGDIKERQGLLSYRETIENKWPEYSSNPETAFREAKKGK
jgi:hypothetical protein